MNPSLQSPEFDRAAAALLRGLRSGAGLRAGSLLVTLIGDAIAPRGGVAALSSLIAAGQLFGLTERHIRTAVGRLAQDGWIDLDRVGRLSFYRLSGTGRRRFADATARIYGPSDKAWDGHWTLLALPPATAALRQRITGDLALLGFGQLRSGLLVHPAPLSGELKTQLVQLGIAATVVAMRAAAVAGLSDLEIARTAWNLDDLEARYRRFLKLFAPLVAASGARQSIAGEAAFVVRILLIHEYRRIHLRDPMLPTSLLPPDWMGREAHEACRLLYARTFKAAEAYVSSSLRNAQGPLPPAGPEVLQRFGGLRLR